MIALVPFLLAATPVVRAVVYPDRAQVTRRASVACGPHAQLAFEDLPPAADPGSMRASTSVGEVAGLRVEQRPQLAAYAPEVDALRVKLRALDDTMAALRDGRARDDAQVQLSTAYDEVVRTQLSREMAQGKADTAAWNTAVQGQLDARLAAQKDAVKLGAELGEKERERDALTDRLAALNQAAAQSATRAEVIVACPAGQSAQIELTYLVGGAGWEPAYEARAAEGATELELSVYATVHQSTGEPWKGAQLTLSTAVPRANATPPTLFPLRVGGYDEGDRQKVLVRRDEQQHHAESSASSAVGGKNAMTAVDQGVSIQLEVPQPADVAGNGTAARLFVAKPLLPAHFALRAVPKLAPLVFHVADVTNTAPFPLLPGPLDVYRGGAFAGRHALARVAQGAPVHLTFGTEESVQVKRDVVEEVKKDTGLFGGNRRFHYAYRFELRSGSGAARKIEISEHVPVSELDDVKVELEKETTPGYALKADDGIVTWTVPLPPDAAAQLTLAFHVDVPSSYDTSGL